MRIALVCLAVAAGCGATPEGSDAGLPDLAAPDGGVDGPKICSVNNVPEGGVCLMTVSGKVVDAAGAGIGNLIVSVCAGECFFGKTAADGTFTTAIDSFVDENLYALELHGRPDKATYYTRLPSQAGADLTYPAPLLLPLLPATGPALSASTAGQSVTSGDVTLTIGPNISVQFSVEDVANGAVGKQFRALTVAQPSTLPFVDSSAPPDALYGFTPFEAVFSKKVTLTFVNPGNWPAGTAVDVLQMRPLVGGTPPAGRFEHAAYAHVAADGGTVTMDPGEGVTNLTWVELKKQ